MTKKSLRNYWIGSDNKKERPEGRSFFIDNRLDYCSLKFIVNELVEVFTMSLPNTSL